MEPSQHKKRLKSDAKKEDLAKNTSDGSDQVLTTNQGVKINDDNNSLKAGERGPSLLEDFILREKITHFDHERIPERIVHARGSAAHGFFEVTDPIPQFCKASFLQKAGQKTPVFVRFSTVAGFRGSTDLARDVRGFAVKFYTEEGNFDLVGNNIPVFFIQDAAKFPDLIHAVKPEPDNEIPQAASAHDTFWDFISLMPESMHMIMWAMSDRAIPRSYRMMEGFGVHTFRLVNEKGESHFVKFHWKPKLGTHSVLWDEAQKISGKNSDFHREDLFEAIKAGNFPEWSLGLQIVSAKDEHRFGFDLLDPTKLLPEEEVPVRIVGRLVLDRNPDNFFAETEQVAFHPGHVVPGIDFTNDPLLQGRLFSYTDTQLSRLGGPNFHEIPINRPLAPSHNNQRDGIMRQEINVGKSSYFPNSLGGGCPYQALIAKGGFVSFGERMDGHKVRERSTSFADHFSQARLFYNSQNNVEKNHIAKAFRFELGKVKTEAIRIRMLTLLVRIDDQLAGVVAQGLGLALPETPSVPLNHGVGADADAKKHEPKGTARDAQSTPSRALSVIDNPTNSLSVETRRIAVLCSDKVSSAGVHRAQKAIEAKGATAHIVAPHLGTVGDAGAVVVEFTYSTASSVLFDAVFVPGGATQAALSSDPDVRNFVVDAFQHCKTIGAEAEGSELVRGILKPEAPKDDVEGLVLGSKGVQDFLAAAAKHRHWSREKMLF